MTRKLSELPSQVIQQNCAAAVIMGQAVVKGEPGCKHGGGNFAFKPVEIVNETTAIVTHQCADRDCSKVRRFQKVGDEPWRQI